jgi:hypothetical protein
LLEKRWRGKRVNVTAYLPWANVAGATQASELASRAAASTIKIAVMEWKRCVLGLEREVGLPWSCAKV